MNSCNYTEFQRVGVGVPENFTAELKINISKQIELTQKKEEKKERKVRCILLLLFSWAHSDNSCDYGAFDCSSFLRCFLKREFFFSSLTPILELLQPEWLSTCYPLLQ